MLEFALVKCKSVLLLIPRLRDGLYNALFGFVIRLKKIDAINNRGYSMLVRVCLERVRFHPRLTYRIDLVIHSNARDLDVAADTNDNVDS